MLTPHFLSALAWSHDLAARLRRFARLLDRRQDFRVQVIERVPQHFGEIRAADENPADAVDIENLVERFQRAYRLNEWQQQPRIAGMLGDGLQLLRAGDRCSLVRIAAHVRHDARLFDRRDRPYQALDAGAKRALGID